MIAPVAVAFIIFISKTKKHIKQPVPFLFHLCIPFIILFFWRGLVWGILLWLADFQAKVSYKFVSNGWIRTDNCRMAQNASGSSCYNFYFHLVVTLSPSPCSLGLLTSSPSLSVTPSDQWQWLLSQPGVRLIYLNKLSLDGSLRAISSVIARSDGPR